MLERIVLKLRNASRLKINAHNDEGTIKVWTEWHHNKNILKQKFERRESSEDFSVKSRKIRKSHEQSI